MKHELAMAIASSSINYINSSFFYLECHQWLSQICQQRLKKITSPLIKMAIWALSVAIVLSSIAKANQNKRNEISRFSLQISFKIFSYFFCSSGCSPAAQTNFRKKHFFKIRIHYISHAFHIMLNKLAINKWCNLGDSIILWYPCKLSIVQYYLSWQKKYSSIHSLLALFLHPQLIFGVLFSFVSALGRLKYYYKQSLHFTQKVAQAHYKLNTCGVWCNWASATGAQRRLSTTLHPLCVRSGCSVRESRCHDIAAGAGSRCRVCWAACSPQAVLHIGHTWSSALSCCRRNSSVILEDLFS